MSLPSIAPKEKIQAVSYFLPDRLEIIFLKTAEGRYEIEDKLWVPVSDSFSEKEAAHMQKQIKEKFQNAGVWIHIVMRQGGFVKTFSIPNLAEDKMNSILMQKVHEEMPHLANDIIYHIGTQESKMPERREALLFGIAKATLEDQLGKLERFGIIPDSVMLSTEILFWYYQNSPAASAAPNATLIHEAGRQLELIYVNEGRLVQSRWFKKDAYEQEGIESLLQTTADSGRLSPGKTWVMGGDFRNANISYEPLEGQENNNEDPILWKAGLKAFDQGAVFDFTPAIWEKKRTAAKTARESASLLTWGIVFAVSLLLFCLTQTAVLGLQNAWFAGKAATQSAEIKDLKVLRTKAAASESYQVKKMLPVLLLEKIRTAIPSGVLLDELEYAQNKNSFSMRGEAVGESLIHDFLGALQNQSLHGVVLERIEAQDDNGGRIYQFEIKGSLKQL